MLVHKQIHPLQVITRQERMGVALFEIRRLHSFETFHCLLAFVGDCYSDLCGRAA